MSRFFVLIYLFLAHNGFADSAIRDFKLELPPDWIRFADVPSAKVVPVDEIDDGSYHLLYDQQIHVPEQDTADYFFDQAILIANEEGLENNSQISIDFDPAYEHLRFFRMEIIRDGRQLDWQNKVQLRVFQREQELDQLIYDGSQTANLIVSDVRVGDVLRYAYALKGDNPIFNGAFSYSTSIEWSVPIEYQRIRILWEKSAPLQIRSIETKHKMERLPYSKGSEYLLEIFRSKAIYNDSETPAWYSLWGKFSFSEMSSWKQVVDWALPLYASAYTLDAFTREKVAQIELKAKSDAEKISAALRLVQNEVRYLGLEMGTNSHVPSPAEETWQRRFGDCKDKTLALIAILNAMGFKAYPALVNTELEHSIESYGPSLNVFDHVLVGLDYAGELYWLDPTRRHQTGLFPNIFQAQYGRALLVRKGEERLRTMEKRQAVIHQHITEKYQVQGGIEGKIDFSVVTEFLGASAERTREQFASESSPSLQKRYLEFYQNYYPELNVNDSLRYRDDSSANIFTVEEFYSLSEAWKKTDIPGRYETDFYFSSLYGFLPKPDVVKRKGPYAISYPVELEYKIVVQFDNDDWSFSKESSLIENNIFKLSRDVRFVPDQRRLFIDFSFGTKTAVIKPENMANYIAEREKALALVTYGLYQNSSTTSKQNEAAQEEVVDDNTGASSDILYFILLGLMGFVAVGLALTALVLWMAEESERKANAKRGVNTSQALYFQSPLLVFILSLMTFNLYHVYWYYRLWAAKKEVERATLWPFWRAVFAFVWFLPACRYIEKVALQRGAKPFLGVFLSIILFSAYLIALLASKFFAYASLCTLLLALLLAILAYQVQLVYQGESRDIGFMRGLRVRHFLFLPVAIGLHLFFISAEQHWFPQSQVLEGGNVPASHLRYLKRNKVVAADEEINLFYSTAYFDWKEDGNGFSDSAVFSYWQEDGRIQSRRADFEYINDMVMSKSNGFGDPTVEIHLHDGSDFLLFLPSNKKEHTRFVQALKARWESKRAQYHEE